MRDRWGEGGEDTVGRLDSDRDTHRSRPNPKLGALGRAQAAMRGYLRVGNRGLDPPEAGGKPDHLEARQHSLHGRAATFEVESEHPAGSIWHEPPRHR